MQLASKVGQYYEASNTPAIAHSLYSVCKAWTYTSLYWKWYYQT